MRYLCCPAMQKHHLTNVLISARLYETLGELVEAEELSSWLEDAAWSKIKQRQELEMESAAKLVNYQEDLLDLGIGSCGGREWSVFGDCFSNDA